MRILMLSQFYPPILGGEEQHVRNLAIELTRRGHVVEVLTIATPRAEAGAEVEDGVRIHRVSASSQRIPWAYSDAARPHALPVLDPETARAIGRVIERGRFHVLHAHNWIVNSAVGIARRSNCPLVLTLHDYSHVCATKRLMRRERVCSGPGLHCLPCATRHYGPLIGGPTVVANAVAWLRRNSNVAVFIAVSWSVADRSALPRSGVSFEVIPNFVPDELVEVESSPNHDGPLLYVGDLSRDKGVEALVGAYSRLRDPPPLVLVGRQVRGTLVDAVAGVRILDPLPHNEVLPLIRSACAVVVPSICPDACPTVVLEAMALGRPVVAAASGGIVDMVEDWVNGRLVRPGDEADLASALEGILRAPGHATRMAQVALQSVRRFTASAVAEQIEAVYDRVARPGVR